MTIDERLEKLTERHEALVQYTALKYRMDQERHEALAQSVELLTMDLRTTATLVREVVGGIQSLSAIAPSHEQRLSNLEG